MTKIDKIVLALLALALMVGLCMVLSFILDRIVEICYIRHGYEQRVQADAKVWIKIKEENEKH